MSKKKVEEEITDKIPEHIEKRISGMTLEDVISNLTKIKEYFPQGEVTLELSNWPDCAVIEYYLTRDETDWEYENRIKREKWHSDHLREAEERQKKFNEWQEKQPLSTTKKEV